MTKGTKPVKKNPTGNRKFTDRSAPVKKKPKPKKGY